MFNQLYIQTEYSLLQSACKLEPLFAKLKYYNISAAAIADEGTMYGTIKFYKEAIKNGIKPIISLKVNYQYNDVQSSIILYALNDFGYKNLMKISSRICLNKGVVDFEYLAKSALGLLAIIPFEESILYKYHQAQDLPSAFSVIELLKNTYDILYIGLPLPKTLGDDFDTIYNLYQKRSYNLVALPKVSFINKDDYDAYITLQSIRMNATLYKASFVEEYHYLLSQEEINSAYLNYPSLTNATIKIANLCNVQITFGKYQLPLYQEGLDAKAYLQNLCYKGLEKRTLSFKYPYDKKLYLNRLNYELDTIKEMGFCDYFLIVYDYVKFAKKNNIYVGPGRGSAPASLVSYCLGITDIDPIYHNLLFERFLNKERISMPDIDIDFEDDRRDEVIKYVGQKYGKERVAHIVTFGTFKVKLAINDCARVYKLPSNHLKEINKCLQTFLVGKNAYTLNLQDAITQSSALQKLMNDYDDIRQVLTIAATIQGLPKNISTHAAGIIITRYDLVNFTPLDEGLDDIYQTQYEASDLEELGLLKMDFLGLKNLTNIIKTVALIRQDDPTFVLPKEENDAKTYQMLARGDVSGVFQLESAGMRKVIMDLKTSTLEDIVQALALYRPGPMDIIPNFIKRKFKLEQVVYPHPDLEPILKETYGMIVYQDQIMLIACKFAGYSLGRADILRRAVSKKKKEVLEKERQSFIESSLKQGYSQDTASLIYDYIVKFADYGFNKAHSVAYAKIAYLTAYLKCHYFSYYFSTLMSSFMMGSNLLEYIKEATSKNVLVNPPSINKSLDLFSVINGEIYLPLSIIKGLGSVKVFDILEERKKGLFTSFEDFILRIKNIIALSLIENVIYSGALDEFGLTKKAMIENYKTIIEQDMYSFVKDVIKIDYSKDEYNYGFLKDQEFLAIGLNIKYNFFQQFRGLYQTYQLCKINTIMPNQKVKTLGMIEKVREITTKQNEKMAFMEISDDTSKIEVVIFPKVYQNALPLIKGSMVIVYGIAQHRTTTQIVVEQIKKI